MREKFSFLKSCYNFGMKDKKLTSLITDLQQQASTKVNAPALAKNSMNVLEEFVEKVESLEDKVQKLENELNKLKGETVPPALRHNTPRFFITI